MANVFLDTNTLVYARDITEPEKQARMQEWLKTLARSNQMTLSVQVLNEYFWTMTRKFAGIVPESDVREDLADLAGFCRAPLTRNETIHAVALRDATNYGWWDCLLLASAQAAGCRCFLTEDLHHGHVVGSLRILDPFELEPSEISRA